MMKRHAGWMCFCAMLALLLAGGVCAGAETNTHPPQMLAVRFPGAQFADYELHVDNMLFYYSFLVFLKLRAKQPLPQNPEAFVTRVLWSDWEIGGIELHHLDRLQMPMLKLTDELVQNKSTITP